MLTYNNDKDKNEEGKLIDKEAEKSGFLVPKLKKILASVEGEIGGNQIKYIPE